jgi:hypothetical protein
MSYENLRARHVGQWATGCGKKNDLPLSIFKEKWKKQNKFSFEVKHW